MNDITIIMLGRLLPERVPEFASILMRHGCPQDIAYRHADTMMTAHQKRTAIRPFVNRESLKAELDAIGIALEVEGETT